MKFELKGVIPALITPVDNEGRINVEVLEKLINHLIDQGADGFYVGGATGEGIVLSTEAHKTLTREAVRIINKRVPCIVHVARMNYDEMIELAQYAESVGVDALSAIPPIFYKYNNDAIYNYFAGLAKSVNIPIIIYNNPNANVAFPVELLERLFAVDNITGIKWTNPNFFPVMQFKPSYPEVEVINGPDEMLLCGLAAGCNCGIGTTYNFQLPIIKQIYEAFVRGDINAARLAQQKANKIIAAVIKVDTILATKAILEYQGFDVCHPLFPKEDFTAEQKATLIKEVREAGLDI